MWKKRWLSGIAVAIFFVFGSLEAFARFGLGLGTPPLSITDPTIEYMFAPNQDVFRFGNRQLYNEYAMRSEKVIDHKPEGEFRILSIGDSVLNGGSLTDHEDLATTLLSHDGVQVLNASAGSWGPQNMLAYIEKFGLFEADLLIVVLSSGDVNDVPTFAPLNPKTHPTEEPFLALTEAITRYLPRYLPDFGASASSENLPVDDGSDPRALAAVISLANQPIPTCFVLHPTRDEYQTGVLGSGATAIRAAADEARIIDESPFIRSGADFRDNIHLAINGQRALAEAMASCWS